MTEQDTAVEQEDEQAEASGGDAEEGKAQQHEESDPPGGQAGDGSGDSEDEKDESQKAQEKEEEREAAAEKVKELEKDPPDELEDWPDDAAKYETLGGPEGEHGYHEGPEEQGLGPSSLRHHEDGSVSIAGEKVDNPEDYKSHPIPGGPTDPEAGQDLTTEKIRERQGRDMSSSQDDDSGDDESEDSDEDSSDGASASSDSDSDSGDESESKEEEKVEQSS